MIVIDKLDIYAKAEIGKSLAGFQIGSKLELYLPYIHKTIDGKKVLDNVTFRLNKEDKVAFTSMNDVSITTLFKIIMGEMEPDSGTFKWGVTTSQAYLPKDNSEEFSNFDMNKITDDNLYRFLLEARK